MESISNSGTVVLPPSPHLTTSARRWARSIQISRHTRGAIRSAVGKLDKQMPFGQKPADENELFAVIELAALAHGEWVRIHPFAHGNGRVARIWANWVAIRYGLPPFIRIKPRPAGLLYQQAAHEGMDRAPAHRGDHTTTTKLFLDLLVNGP